MKISSALFQCESQFVSNGRTLFEQNISDRALSRLSVDSAPPVSPSTRLVETRFISALRLETSFPGGSAVKASAWKVGDAGSIPGSGRSPGEGNGNPLQYSCLENSMDRETRMHATVHGLHTVRHD